MGDSANVAAAQAVLMKRAKANGEASQGKYVPVDGEASGESLFVANYSY